MKVPPHLPPEERNAKNAKKRGGASVGRLFLSYPQFF
jgi:hypothetical protein